MQEVGPIRVEMASASIRLSDILFQTGPCQKDFRTFEFLDLVLKNDLTKTIEFSKSQNSENREYFAWLLSNIIHERLHILQSFVSPLGSMLARRQWALILNIPAVLCDYGLRRRFFYRLNWNLDGFMCDHFNVRPSETLSPVGAMLDNATRYFDGLGRNEIFEKIQQSQTNGSESYKEIEARRAKFKSGYLLPIQVFELWAYIIQITFLRRHFPGEADVVVDKYILPLLEETYGDFRKFFKNESDIDIFNADERETSIILVAIFFACAHEIGGAIGDFNHAGTRLFMASRVLCGRSGIGPEDYFALLEKMLPGRVQDAIKQNFDNDGKLLEAAGRMAGDPNAATSQVESVYNVGLPVLLSYTRNKKIIVRKYYSNLTFLSSDKSLNYLEKIFMPPVVIECNSRMSNGGIESFYGSWAEGRDTRLELSPRHMDFNDDYDSTAEYWTRILSINQNVIDMELYSSATGTPIIDQFMSFIEPLANLLLEDFSCRALLTEDKKRLKKVLSEYGEGICESDWTRIEGKYLSKFIPYVRKCDFCGEIVSESDGVFVIQDGYHRINHEEDGVPIYVVLEGYHYVHKACEYKKL